MSILNHGVFDETASFVTKHVTCCELTTGDSTVGWLDIWMVGDPAW